METREERIIKYHNNLNLLRGITVEDLKKINVKSIKLIMEVPIKDNSIDPVLIIEHESGVDRYTSFEEINRIFEVIIKETDKQ